MASISKDNQGRYRLQVLLPGEVRKGFSIGKMTKKQAVYFQQRVDDLEVATKSGTIPGGETLSWLKSLDDEFLAKLAEWRILPESISHRLDREISLSGLIERCIAQLRVKNSTLKIWNRVQNNLINFFGEERSIQTISTGDAKDFRTWMLTSGSNGHPYSEATTRKAISIARQIFAYAIDCEFTAKNPFSSKDLPTTIRSNRERVFYIDRSTIEKVMDACPDQEWRLLIALSRYAGLRCPSEHLALRWSDINWENKRMSVQSSKTEHHAGKESRIMPIFPELFELLESAHQSLSEGASDYVITRYRDSTVNLRTSLLRYIRMAGFNPWPKLWHNLRSSCQTDLAERFPSHVVCAWVGNSERVALEHYLQVTDDHFEKAITEKSCAKVVQKGLKDACNALQPKFEKCQRPREIQAISNLVNRRQTPRMATTGLEPVTPSM